MCVFYIHYYLILTMTSRDRHNSISQVKFKMFQEHNHENSVNIAQEIKRCHYIRTFHACSVSLLSLKLIIILTSSIMDYSAYFEFNINEIVQNVLFGLRCLSLSTVCGIHVVCSCHLFLCSVVWVSIIWMCRIYLTTVVSVDVFVISSVFLSCILLL